MNVHEVKPVRLVNRCAPYCGSSLAVLNSSVAYIVLPCVADVCAVDCAVYIHLYSPKTVEKKNNTAVCLQLK